MILKALFLTECIVTNTHLDPLVVSESTSVRKVQLKKDAVSITTKNLVAKFPSRQVSLYLETAFFRGMT
jgi:hypothetical protein